MRGHAATLALVLLALLAAKASALNCARPPPSTVINGAWPAACTNVAPGGRCYATCKTSPAFYATNPQPWATCQSDGTWVLNPDTVLDSLGRPVCQPGCQDKPSDDLLKWGMFPFSCAGTPNGKACVGLCDAAHYGAPRMTCAAGRWTNFMGSCNNTAPPCSYPPTLPVTNARWPAPAACSDVGQGGQCQAVCNPGYASASPPAVTCTGHNTWSSSLTGSPCRLVCPGAPPDTLLVDGTFAACANKTPIGSDCVGTCLSGFGTPRVRCTSGGWDITGMTGGDCGNVPVCTGLPAPILDASIPPTAAGTPMGGTVSAVCNDNFVGTPTVTCISDGAGGAMWGDAVGQCTNAAVVP